MSEDRHPIFKEMQYKTIKIIEGVETREIPGANVFEIIPPSRGMPYWIIRHADDYDEKEQIMIAANVAVVIEATKLDQNEIDEDEEAVIE